MGDDRAIDALIAGRPYASIGQVRKVLEPFSARAQRAAAAAEDVDDDWDVSGVLYA
jgi:hypothetical protein